MIGCPWNTLHMSNTCQESIENSSMKTWRPTVVWPKVKSHTRVPYLSSLGLMCTTGQREREKGKYWSQVTTKDEIKKKGAAPYLLKSMLITTWQHLRQTHDAKKKNACKTNKKDNPCWGKGAKWGGYWSKRLIKNCMCKFLRPANWSKDLQPKGGNDWGKWT